MSLPKIIQGGMGVAVSGWPLARAVSLRGQLGVVSGTGIDTVMVRRLQVGDEGGHLRRAFDHFPIPELAQRVWDKYFVPGGKPPSKAFRSKPVPALKNTRPFEELVVLANFVEVFLAKEGHGGVIGLNLLEKIQIPILPSLFGAMLAGVDVVLIGAGIPRQIPAALDSLARMEPAEYVLDVTGAKPGEVFKTTFDPSPFVTEATALSRPKFLAIISSTALAMTLARKCPGVDGFVIEGWTAGGHNAPPRGAMVLDEHGEPVYGPRDLPDLEAIRELGLPFWLAGSFGNKEKLEEALGLGAAGIQVGTAFAFCSESGIAPQIKERVIRQSLGHQAAVFTDPAASPTGFPFKVLDVEETLSKESVYDERERICDLGYLRESYRKENGEVGFRCAGEPLDDYAAKGGDVEATEGRKCLCNALLSTAGLGQIRHGTAEPPIVTAGDDVIKIAQFLKNGAMAYTANDVLDALLT